MRTDQIAHELQGYLRPVEGLHHVQAMSAPPVPRNLPASTPSLSRSFNEANLALGRLAGATRHWSNADRLTRMLARREAVQSSQIEGTQADLAQLLDYEMTRSAEGKPSDVHVTLRYVEALEYGQNTVQARGRAPISLSLLHQLHQILMQDGRPDGLKGTYRRVQTWLGTGPIENAVFVPAPPDSIEASMRDLEQGILQAGTIEGEETELSLIAKLAIAHAQFETIHPYQDGNGRVGRLIMSLLLVAEGHPPLYLSGPLLRNQKAYYAALHQVQTRGNWEPWLRMACETVVDSANDAIAIADDLHLLLDDWSARTRDHRRDSVARRLPALLLGQPVVTVREIAKVLCVSTRAALTGVDQLVKLGLLIPGNERRWGRTFHAHEILERLSRGPNHPRPL